MKKIILFVVGTLLSVAMVNAQTQPDSARTKTINQSGTAQSQNMYQNYPTKDMKRIQSTEIPASLRTTLQGSEYTGWENGSMYYNNTTNEYFYQPMNSSKDKQSTQSSKNSKNATWYKFDQNGQRVPDSKP